MKITFHEKYLKSYTSDPAAASGRLEPIIKELKKHKDYEFITPIPAIIDDILLAHSRDHIERIKNQPIIYFSDFSMICLTKFSILSQRSLVSIHSSISSSTRFFPSF